MPILICAYSFGVANNIAVATKTIFSNFFIIVSV
jgi:hypothetical protein